MYRRLKKLIVSTTCLTFIICNSVFSMTLAKEINVSSKVSNTKSKIQEKSNNDIPKKYDLRKLGLVTSVKNQGALGTCWSFAAMGSLEACALKKFGKTLDFSEIHMARLCHGLRGASNYEAASYFTTWLGPVFEEDAPYPNSTKLDIKENRDAKARYHLQEFIKLPFNVNPEDNGYIKRKIMKYGPATTTITYAGRCFLPKYNSFYNDAQPGISHAVLIVGWDDDFSKENFVKPAPGNGAFICKNSWGTGFGEGGYFYVSYYNRGLKLNNYIYNGLEPINNYDEIHDTEADIPFGSGSYTTPCNSVDGDKEKLAAVSIYTKEPREAYTLYINKNYNDKLSRSNKVLQNAEKLKDVYFEEPGFHTVKLDKPIELEKGKRFATIFNKSNLRAQTNKTQENIFGKFTLPYSFYHTRIYTVKKNLIKPTSISLDKNYVKLFVGETIKLNAKVMPENVDYKDVKWSTDNKNVVDVSDLGRITIKNKGKAVITAKTIDEKCEAKCIIEGVYPIELLNLDKNVDKPLKRSDTITFTFNKNIKSFNENKIYITDENRNNIDKKIILDKNKLILNICDKEKNAKNYNICFEEGSVIDQDEIELGMKRYSYVVEMAKDIIINFKDKNLEEQLKSKLKIINRQITSDDMKKLESLYLTYNGKEKIKYLDGLEYAINLKVLSCSNSDIVSLKPLQGLILLRDISINSSNVTNIKALSEMKNLNRLTINHSNLETVDGIENLSKITNLNLSYNRIKSILGLQDLNKLEYVDVSNNNIEDISSLKKCTNLKLYKLEGNQINNLQPLVEMINGIALQDADRLEIKLENNQIGKVENQQIENIMRKYRIKNYDQKKLNITYFNGKRINSTQRIEEKVKDNQPITVEFNRNILVKDKDEITLRDLNGKKILSKSIIYDNRIILIPLEDIKRYRYVYVKLNSFIKDKETGEDFFRYDSIRVSAIGQLQGDLNKDGKIDIKDLAILAQEYGREMEKTNNWSFDKDINKNGVIDIYDVVNLSNLIK